MNDITVVTSLIEQHDNDKDKWQIVNWGEKTVWCWRGEQFRDIPN